MRIEAFAPDDARQEAFEAVRKRVDPAAAPGPVSPGARCLVGWRGGEPVARLSVEIAGDVRGIAGPTGIVGHYEAVDTAAGVGLLHHLQDRMTEAGVLSLVGPMNGSTWARYRLALPDDPGPQAGPHPLAPSPNSGRGGTKNERQAGGARIRQQHPPGRASAEEISDAPPEAYLDPLDFFTEPRNPAADRDQFLQAGFAVAALYESRIVEELSATRPRAQALAARVAAGGICMRALDVRRFEEELRTLFRFTATVFQGNPFYRPIDLSAFGELYRPMLPSLDPEIVRLALDSEGRLVGFILALPDLLSAGSGRPDRVVLKTLATTPETRRLGLGACLADEVHRLAHEKGYRAVIHALMHQENASVRLSRRYHSRLFRRYALYQWSHRDPAPAH